MMTVRFLLSANCAKRFMVLKFNTLGTTGFIKIPNIKKEKKIMTQSFGFQNIPRR
jgi:hypothetical protein